MVYNKGANGINPMIKDYDLLSYYSEEELAEMFGDDEEEQEHPSLSVNERNPSLK